MSQKNPGVKLRWEVRPKIFEEEKRKSLILLMQTVPGSTWGRRSHAQIFQELCRIVLGIQRAYSQASQRPGSAPKRGVNLPIYLVYTDLL